MSFDKLTDALNFLKIIENNYKFLFPLFASAVLTILFITSPLWYRVFSEYPQADTITLSFIITLLILFPCTCMVSNFYCWGKGITKNKKLKKQAESEAKIEKIANLLGLRGIRHGNGEVMEHKYPYPDKTILGLAWTLRIKRHGAAVGQPFCINCKVPMYDFTPNAYDKNPITVTITCIKCKKNYLIDDLEQTVKNHNFDLLHEQNYLYKLINTDIVDE